MWIIKDLGAGLHIATNNSTGEMFTGTKTEVDARILAGSSGTVNVFAADENGNKVLIEDVSDNIVTSVRDSSGNVTGLSAGGQAIPTALPSVDIELTGSITFAGGNVLVTLPSAYTGVSAFVYPTSGEIGVDYTSDATPHVSTGNWVPVYGGNISANESLTINAWATGIRLRPIAAGAAATYIVRR